MKPHLDYEDPEAVTRLGEWLKNLSLEAFSFHAPFYAHFDQAREGSWLSLSSPSEEVRQESLALTKSAMYNMANLGCKVAVIHPCAPSTSGDSDSFDVLRNSLEELLPLAEQLALTLAVENIPASMGHARPLSQFIGEADHPLLKICLDTGHANITDGDQIEDALQLLAPYTAATHLHDNDGVRDAHMVPGNGNFPWVAGEKILADTEYTGPLTYELRRGKEESYKEILGGLGNLTFLKPAGKNTT